MKICIAQTRPIKGDIAANIKRHFMFIERAVAFHVSAIFFPELSLTGYEPSLANDLATDQNDRRLDIFQKLSDSNDITIGLGVPTRSNSGVRISMIIFQPGHPRQTYSKQRLHPDEFPYFVNGMEQLILTVDNKKIAPAICYESKQPGHSEYAIKLGAEIYVACVADSHNGVKKAMSYYSEVARKYAVPVLMSNSVGFSDDFECLGSSAAWNKKGDLVGQLDDKSEGILIFNTTTEEINELLF